MLCHIDRVSLLPLLMVYLALVLPVSYLFSIEQNKALSATMVKIPSYDQQGRLSWELKASEVESLSADQLVATNPVLAFYGQQQGSQASSSHGVFDLGNGRAFGEEVMDINGRGFRASGSSWDFVESPEMGNHRLRLNKDAQVAFDNHFDALFAGLDQPAQKRATKRTSPKVSPTNKEEQEFPTLAQAYQFELISDEKGGHQLILDGNVSVEMEGGASLVCNHAEIVIIREENSTSSKDVKIDSIHASGEVYLRQPGRSFWADVLKWESNESTVSILGNARVLDDTWGEAVGEAILLEKGNGRVQVLGGEKKRRSRISLPNVPGFVLPENNDPPKP